MEKGGGSEVFLVSYLTFRLGGGALNTQQRHIPQHFHQNQFCYNCDREENIPLLAPDLHVTSSPSQHSRSLVCSYLSLK